MDSTGETLVAFVKLLSNLHLPLLGKVIELVIKRSALPFSRRQQFKYFPRPHRQQLFKWRSLVCDMCKKVIFVIITACHYQEYFFKSKICLRLRTRTGGSERILSPAFSERLATYHWKNPWKCSEISFKKILNRGFLPCHSLFQVWAAPCTVYRHSCGPLERRDSESYLWIFNTM